MGKRGKYPDAEELRRSAEKRLRERPAAGPADASPGGEAPEAQRARESQLRQQNRTLLRAVKRNREALRRYRELYEHAPVGLCTLSPDGVIQRANRSAATALGTRRDALVGRRLTEFAGSDDTARLRSLLSRAAAGRWKGASEVAVLLPDDTRFLRLEFVPRRDGEPGCHAVLSDITEQKRAAHVIWTQANYDGLTAVPNRHLFQDRLADGVRRAQRAGLSLALLFIDLDGFKAINDTLGHAAGDAVLVEVARRIRSCVRSTDTTGRLGGDEFGVILADLEATARIDEVAENLLAQLSEPLLVEQQELHVTASIGIALYPTDGLTYGDLLQHADQAMYVAKTARGGGFSYFKPAMQRAAQERQRLLDDLRQALETDQLEVYFQPIFELASSRVAQVQALLRWNHPEQGVLAPETFMPLVAGSGLMREIDDWVFRASARAAQRWSALDVPAVRRVQLPIHTDGLRALSSAVENRWSSHLRAIGVPADRFVVRVDETVLLEDNADVVGRLQQMRQEGFRFVLDGFGRGAVSIAGLKRCGIDYLKLDRHLVEGVVVDPESRAVVEATIAMAKRLGIQVIAVGVETQEQRDLLLSAGCDFGQGFLLAAPMDEHNLETRIA